MLSGSLRLCNEHPNCAESGQFAVFLLVHISFCYFSAIIGIRYNRSHLLLMSRFAFIVLVFGLALPGVGFAQAMRLTGGIELSVPPASALPAYPLISVDTPPVPELASTSHLPVMSPDLALSTYLHRATQQYAELSAYSAVTIVRAQLPDSSQQGEFELQRKFEAPHTLLFTPVHYTGDGFVKNNVITRLLQSEVDHVQKDDPSLTAVSPLNYKFSYKGAGHVQDRLVHIYQVKPHKKRMGLFKGRVYLDAHTGTLVRAEGSVVKSPSFFVKHIEFWQEYADVQSFTLPVRIHSEAKARIVGRTIVDIVHRDYQPVPAPSVQTARQLPAM